MPDNSETGETQPHFGEGSGMALVLYRLGRIESKLDEINADHERRIRELEEKTTRLSERLTIFQLGQAVFTAISSAIAAMVGHRGP